MSPGFLGNADSMLLFYRYCLRYGITDVQKKLQVLGRIAKRGKMKYIRDTKALVTTHKTWRITRKGENNVN